MHNERVRAGTSKDPVEKAGALKAIRRLEKELKDIIVMQRIAVLQNKNLHKYNLKQDLVKHNRKFGEV
jgi:hypothetical protein